ncbi:OadG family transporter subunit [Luteococcus sp. Sow4_B9]|uniref:OadG family transporter subunit n=1 Tax=Luteococcus sp. Sow4_B9 TaxID=3438792 RepID=UPI003F94A7EC
MNNLMWGLEMTVVGMGVVFALLALLMGVLTLLGKLDRPAKPELAPAAETAPAPLAAVADDASPAGDAPESVASQPAVQILSGGLTVDQATAVALAVITHAEVRRQQAAPAMRTHAPGSQIHTSRWVGVGRAAQNQSWKRR